MNNQEIHRIICCTKNLHEKIKIDTMEIKVNALMLKGVDYKDNDKMLTLYTLESGLMGACIRGVKKASAKLKFASEPFCFGEYVLSVNADRATVISATEIESFYNLRLNILSYYCATAISEFLLKYGAEEGDEPLFMLAINTIKRLNFEQNDQKRLLVEFIFSALNLLGYGIKCNGCSKCHLPAHLSEYSYFDFGSGELLCEECAEAGATRILSGTADGLQSLLLGDDISAETLNYLLKFFNYYLELKIGEPLNTIKEILPL